jgi:hypothetical protein
MEREPKKIDSLEVRLAPETKRAFMAACRANGESASAVLRTFIHRYLRSASRASTEWTREREMPFMTRHRRAGLALGLAAGAAAAASLTLSGPARATGHPGIEAVFDLMDRDRDGRVSLAEFRAPPVPADDSGAVRLEVTGKAPPRLQDTPESLFAGLDANGDRALVLDELVAGTLARTIATRALAPADRDGDLFLTEGEIAAFLGAERARGGVADPAAGIALLARGVVADHDRDGDGKVALSDLTG